MKGKIIVIEGTDGSGKKTQTEKLFLRLKQDGINVVKQSFPNYDSPCSGGIKQYLAGELGEHADNVDAFQSSILFTSDRVATYLNKDLGLKRHYENGGTIIFDRYVQSNMIHQACKIKDINEVEKFLNWLNELEFGYLSLPKADKIFFLDVPVPVSKKLANDRKDLKAGTAKDIHEEDEIYLTTAYNTAKYVAKKFGWTTINCVDENNNLKSVEQIHEDIYNNL